MDVELVLLSHFLPFETIIKRRVERQESSNSVLTAVEGARSGRNSADFPAEERGLLSDKHNKDHPKISGEMKKSPGKMARSASALGIQTHGDLRRAVEDLVKTIDRDLDNNNWSSVDQGWAALDSLAATLPSELEADLLAALPQFSARAVEALCSHKSVSTTIVVVIEHLATRFGTAIGPFFKSTLSGWENLLQRAGLVAHGPGGRAVDHLVSVASSAPLHEVLHWVAVVLESHDGFKKNPVARERAIKVALAYAKVLITERSPRPADLRNCENIVRLACTDASIAMRDGARELWAFLKQHEAPDKIDSFLASLSERGRENLTAQKAPPTPNPATPGHRSIPPGASRPASSVLSRPAPTAPVTPRASVPRISISTARTPKAPSAAPTPSRYAAAKPGSKTPLPNPAQNPAAAKSPRPAKIDVDSLTMDLANITLSKSRKRAGSDAPEPSSATTVSTVTTATESGTVPPAASPSKPSSPKRELLRSPSSTTSLGEEFATPVTSQEPELPDEKEPKSQPEQPPIPRKAGKTARAAPPLISTQPGSARSSKSSLLSPMGVRASAWALSPGRDLGSGHVGLPGKPNSRILKGPQSAKARNGVANVFDQTLGELNALLEQAGHK